MAKGKKQTRDEYINYNNISNPTLVTNQDNSLI